MNIQPIFEKRDKPVFIAGPCSAETEEQVMSTAAGLVDYKVDLFRAGIWKPRTRPGSFEGVGKEGLRWLKNVKDEYGFKITTEVATHEHVFACLKAGVDVVWLGARTTVNPFSVQEVANALEGVDIPVMIKNPINPDMKLWIGAIERIYKAGIRKIGVIHRGFSAFGKSVYRNVPRWEIPLELKRQFPDIEIIIDSSHICGNRQNLRDIAQKGLDLDYDGIMLETHCNPDKAWSDDAQQVTPYEYGEIISRLVAREPSKDDPVFRNNINELRNQIDVIDKEVMNLLSERMKLAESIGYYKKQNNIMIYQPERWNEVIDKSVEKASGLGLSKDFITKVLTAVHQESINHQSAIMKSDNVVTKE